MLRRRLCRLALFWACFSGTALAFAPAYAQDAAEDKKELKRLRSLFQQAIELEHAGNAAGALQIFREVGQSRMTPQVRFHIAMCEEKLGKLVGALGGYELAKSEADTVGPDFQAEVDSAIDALKQKIPMLTVERGPGADAASIEVDGVALGGASIGRAFPADPGPHAISAKAPGFKDYVTVVQLAEGQHETFIVKLEPREAPKESAAEEDSAAPPTDQAPAQKPSRVVPYVIGGVGVAALVGASVFFYLRQDSLNKVEEQCVNGQCPPEAKADYDDVTAYNLYSQIALGVGIVGVGTAVTMILLEPKAKSTSQSGMRVIPTLSPVSAGLRLQSNF